MVEFICEHCGTSQSVVRKGGMVMLKGLGPTVTDAPDGVDSAALAHEVARLQDEISEAEIERDRRVEAAQPTYGQPSTWPLFVATGFYGLAAVTWWLASFGLALIPLVLAVILGEVKLRPPLISPDRTDEVQLEWNAKIAELNKQLTQHLETLDALSGTHRIR